MAKRKREPEPEYVEVEETEAEPDFDTSTDTEPSTWGRAPIWARVLGVGLVLAVFLVGSFELVYAGKVYPGITADGASVAGLSQVAAAKRVADRTKDFTGHVVTISYGDTNLRIPVAGLGVEYDTDKVAKLAYSYGREGSWGRRLHEQLRALFGRATNFSSYEYNEATLVPYVVDLGDELLSPAADASLSFDSGEPQVTPSQSGTRLDYGRLIQLVSDRMSQASSDPIQAPVYQLAPVLATNSLKAVTDQLGDYLAGPIDLTYADKIHTIDQKTIISWVEVGARTPKSFLVTYNPADIYPPPSSANVGLSREAVKKYVAELASELDQTPQNAGLAMQDGKLAVTQPSRTGIKLNQEETIKSIFSALGLSSGERSFALNLETTQADVNENNLESLGIKEQISQGETYFPGSPSTRLTNVRAGAKRFNGVLLKPGETFSFGKLLGPVGPETGYVPELVILEGHEEKQYGGGLCQVSSTAYRAALLAGLPIKERGNHSFAISYYTWPYAAPGVDATIWYPSLDMKFLNDTGAYLLMQTTMVGTSLKFDFFGTKTKSGVIRGPQFVTGTIDHTKPSRTVFYRDVLNLEGKVVKTDTVYTNYKSSLDFPIQKEFN